MKSNKRTRTRKAVFALLWATCRTFVLLRAKYRTGGYCEVGLACGGAGPIEVAYHVFAAKLGNDIKYDERNLLGACDRCNGSEYFARKRDDHRKFDKRHKEILGEALYNALEGLAGRKQIITAEAIEMTERFKMMIERGDWRK